MFCSHVFQLINRDIARDVSPRATRRFYISCNVAIEHTANDVVTHVSIRYCTVI